MAWSLGEEGGNDFLSPITGRDLFMIAFSLSKVLLGGMGKKNQLTTCGLPSRRYY